MNRIGFISLGCPKALVDSERIVTQLRVGGYDIVPGYDEADLVVVNTCGFIDEAKAESLEAIGQALDENGRVLVTGCLGAKADEILSRYPKVLGVTGPAQHEQVLAAVHEHLPVPDHDPHLDLVPPQGIKLTPRHYAYLKISEGCNHRCSFCIIPFMRGDLVSRPIDDVMREAARLVAAGVKELLVIAQDTSAYGVDLRYEKREFLGRERETRLYDLCEELGKLGVWVRLHYVYPYPHVDRIIPLMAEKKILPYLDVPFQHGSRAVLKAMKRPAHAEDTLGRIGAWRDVAPDITIRSTFIVGFPGETDRDFELLLEWLNEARLDRVGCFSYSPVKGAAANALPDPVPDAVKQERYGRFMELAREISAEKLAEKVGRTLDVLVDEIQEGYAIARSEGDAPEIDGQVFVASDHPLQPGQILTVQVTHAEDYDLHARPLA